MNPLLERGYVELLFTVIKQECSQLLAVSHEDDAPLNRRVAKILSMAHNKRAMDAAPVAQDPFEVLELIEFEAQRGLREIREQEGRMRLRSVLEAAQRRHLVAHRTSPVDALESTRRFGRLPTELPAGPQPLRRPPSVTDSPSTLPRH